jgi:hypothetical protein
MMKDMVTAQKFEVTFGKKGNSAPFQTAGWSKPESGFTWALGDRATLKLEAIDPCAELIIALQGHPFLHSPELASQTVNVYVGNVMVSEFRASGPFTRIARIPGDLLSGGLALHLVQSESRSPAEFGLSDTRKLGIAWHRISFFPRPSYYPASTLGKGKQYRNARDQNTAAFNSFSLTESSGFSDIKTGADFLADEELLRCLRTGEVSCLETLLRRHPEFSKIRIALSAQLPDDPSIVGCKLDNKRNWALAFPAVWQTGTSDPPASKMIAWHFISVLPILAAYASSRRTPGSFILNLADDPHARGVSFCARSDENLLIPDPYFLRSGGYRGLKSSFLAKIVPFSARQPIALWRGSTTGDRGRGGLLDLPRIQLCLLGKRPENTAILDFGLTGGVQLQSDSELEQLKDMDLFSDFIPPERLSDWMFHVDIDGNTNSWPGLFQKLLSGGLVLKVDSPGGWRQWYYDRLQPYVNFVPVAGDLSDLVSKVKFYSYNLAETERIAAAGQELASGLSICGEIFAALEVIEDAIIRESLRH